MGKRKPFAEVQDEYQHKFPGKQLLTYAGIVRPCSIKCPIHGIIEVPSYQGLRNSKYGSPDCGNEAQRVAVSRQLPAGARAARKENPNLSGEHKPNIRSKGTHVGKQKTLTEAQSEYQDKFPGKQLLTYEGVNKACSIKCPTHDIVMAPSYRSTINSKYGCPECGNAAKKAASSAQLTARHVAIQAALKEASAFSDMLEKSTRALDLWEEQKDLLGRGYTSIPFLPNVGLAAGCGIYADEAVSEPMKIPFSIRTLRQHKVDPNHAVCCKVSGDSMEPMLREGTTVGINLKERDIQDGQVYALVQEGLSHIKVLSRESDNRVRMHSLNSEYPDEIVEVEKIDIVGRLFWSSTLY